MTTMKDLKELLLDTVPVNIERIIRSHGIILNKNAKPEEIGISGANRRSGESFIGEIKKEGEEYKILVLGSDHYYRKRFTMAHELGHFVLHKDIIDRRGSIAESTDYQADGLSEEQEREADALAAEVLMPEDKIVKIFNETMGNQNGDREWTIEEMSKMFQVSKAAMRYRLDDLDLN